LVRGISRTNHHAALQLDLHAEFDLGVIYQEWLDVSLGYSPSAPRFLRSGALVRAMDRYSHLAVLVGLSDETL